MVSHVCSTNASTEWRLNLCLGAQKKGAIHSTKISGNFGPKLNGSVRSNRKSFEKTGPPFEVDHFSQSDRLEFWLNGSRPKCPCPLNSTLRAAATFSLCELACEKVASADNRSNPSRNLRSRSELSHFFYSRKTRAIWQQTWRLIFLANRVRNFAHAR